MGGTPKLGFYRPTDMQHLQATGPHLIIPGMQVRVVNSAAGQDVQQRQWLMVLR
jgi:hypothetical protein